MIRATLLLTSALAALPLAPALAQDAGDVTIVLGEDIDLVEPCMATRSNIGRIIMQNVNETLTQYDVKGGQGVLPRLAESWADQGNGTWRFNLRQGVTFSDGSTFDANDVKHSFERATSDQLTCETPRYFGDTKLTFNVVDDHTIDVTAEPAQPILPLLLSLVTIVPSETPVEFVRDPVGTGPYKLAEWNPGQNITLERRDDYWGEAPAVEQGDLRVPHRPGRRRGDGRAGRGRPRAVDRGGRRDQPRHRRLLPELRDALPAPRQRHRPDQRHPGAPGAEHGDRPRRLHRHAAARGRGQRGRDGAADDARLEPGRAAVPLRPRDRRRRCSRRPRPTACRSTPRST